MNSSVVLIIIAGTVALLATGACALLVFLLLKKARQVKRLMLKFDQADTLLEAIFAQFPVGLFLKNPRHNYNYVFWNQALTDLTGIKGYDVIGKCDAEVFQLESFSENFQSQDSAVINDEQTLVLEKSIKIGETMQLIKVIKLPLNLPGGKKYLLGIVFPKEKNAVNQQDFDQLLLKVREAERNKSYFLSMMSHEIRTPLNAIIGCSEILNQQNVENDEQKEYCNMINSAGKSLLSLINEVLELSKIESGEKVFEYSYVAIDELLNEVLELHKLSASDKKLKIDLIMPENLPRFWVDRSPLKQILLNLVGNAVKFTAHGGVELRFSHTILNSEFCDLQFEVTDTGIGIAPEYLDKIFEPFSMVNDFGRGNHKYDGSGLGLAISRKLISKMNGSLTVASKRGKGSSFKAVLKMVKYTDNAKDNIPIYQPYHFQFSRAKCRVLLVDDVPTNLRVLEILLKKMGVDCQSCSSGALALEMATKEKFDVVLTDLWMPEMNGGELALILRERFEGIKIFAVTADVDAEGNFKMDSFDGIIIKPITYDKLEFLFEVLENDSTK